MEDNPEQLPEAIEEVPPLQEGALPVLPRILTVIPLRDTVMFPGVVIPVSIGRESSLKALEETLPGSKILAMVTQRDRSQETVLEPADIFGVGVAVSVLKLLRQADNTVILVVQGICRISLDTFL
jgi:ATP-dependent Lon protease